MKDSRLFIEAGGKFNRENQVWKPSEISFSKAETRVVNVSVKYSNTCGGIFKKLILR